MEGERYLGPVSWPVHDLRAELPGRLLTRLAARAAARARRRRRHGGGWSRTAACRRLTGPARARAAGQSGSGGGRAGEQQEFPPLD